MSNLVATDLSRDAPAELCRDCAARGWHFALKPFDIAYCSHRRLGAWRAAGKDWHLLRDIDERAFWATAARGFKKGLILADIPGLAEEIERILIEQSKGSTHH